MEEFYVDRYLCPNNKTQNLDTFSFLMGEMTYVSPKIVYTMDVYKQFKDIMNNPYNFIVGNGGLGKSTYLKQIKTILEKENISTLLIELKSLSEENTLYNKIDQFIKKNNSKEIYILLDAVDEAIDCNIKNIAYKISDAILQVIDSYKVRQKLRILNKEKLNNIKKKKYLKHYNKFIKNLNLGIAIKTIITCRDNRIPDELIPNLKKIYNTKENYTFHLCRLTEEDTKNIAKHLDCDSTEDFINKVKEYNLGSFASSPITLKPLVEMYKNNELDSNSNNYDIYETLMRRWCDESDYRKNKALNNEDNFQLKPTDEILFVASKIAIEMKLLGKNELSYNNDNSIIPVETVYNLTYDLRCGKKIIFTKELVDYTLKTKIFCKINDKFSIEQQTYKDFLVARYLYKMRASEKNLFKLLKVKNDFHPNFTESLAYLAVKNNEIFKTVLKEIPERILLSSVFFCNDEQKEALLNVYLKCVKNDTISFWNYSPGRVFFNKKLYFKKINKILKQKLNTKNKDLKEIIIDIIWDNRLPDFDSEFQNIIFDSSENTRIKTLAIYASYDCQYRDILKEIAKNLNKFNEEINNDDKDQLRGILLCCLYPDYIDTKTMLSYLKEPNTDFFGYYRDFINHKFPKAVNENNSGIFLDWIRENRDIREIVRERYNEGFSDAIKEILKQISGMLNFDLITKYINLQLSEKHAWHITCNDITNKILDNSKFRIFFVNQLIERTSSLQNFEMHICYLPKPPITTYEIPIYLNMYINEKDDFIKQILESLIKNSFKDYLFNNLIDDIDEIYEFIHNNKELLDKFGYFINPIKLNPLTTEPIDEYAITMRRCYYSNLKNKEKEKQRQQKIQELNVINKQVEKMLDIYERNKNLLNTILELFKYLDLEKNSLSYRKDISIILDEHIRWKELPEATKLKIIDIFKEFLLTSSKNEYTNIDNYISENKFNISWNCLGILPLLKESDLEIYNKLLQDWADVIIYISANSEPALKLKQELIKDLYILNPVSVHNSVSKVITNSSGLLAYNFLKSLEAVWNEELASLLFEFSTSADLNDGIKLELIQVLAYHQYQPIEKYIKNNIMELLKANEVDDNKIGNLLNILFYGFQGKTWNFIKNLIYNNKISKEAFLILIRKTASQNIYAQDSMYKLLNSKDLIKLYKWLINKYPEINKSEYKTGVVHNTDWLKDFTEHIPDYFITNGNVDAYKKIKNAYLKNRRNKNNYKKCFNRSLKLTKYNYLQNIKIDYIALTKLENLYYKEKKGWINMKIGKYIFGDNNTNNISENCNNKNINIGAGITITIIVLLIFTVLFCFGIIDFPQFVQLIK